MQKSCIFMQSTSQNCVIFLICDATLGCKYRILLSQIQFYGTPSKLLVTRNQQDHGVPGLKAKICSVIPGALLTNFNEGEGGGGGPTEVHILYPKNHNFRICLPKKITTFFSIPKKSLSPFSATQKYPSIFFLRPKKILVSFIDTKNHFVRKCQTQKNHSDWECGLSLFSFYPFIAKSLK